MENVQIRQSGILMITAMIWGAAFVAQSMGMDYVGPYTFLFSRSLLGAVVLLPVIWFMEKNARKKDLKEGLSQDRIRENALKRGFSNPMLVKGGLVCGFFLFLASIFQQVGIQYTTAGKAGFITAFYIMGVPIIGIFLGKRSGLSVWIAVVLGIIGLYFICINESFSIGRGDTLVICCAFLFSAQILAVDHFIPYVDGVRLAMLEFAVEAVLAGVLMFILETPRMSDIIAGAGPILYAGILSSGVGYTLQIIGQKDLNPAVASLIMSLEAVFSVVFSFIILHERMTGRELLGCVIMFVAVVIAQLPASGGEKIVEDQEAV